MKKIAIFVACLAAMASMSGAYAKISFNWEPSQGAIPNDFRGKLTKFYYQPHEDIQPQAQPEAVVDVVDKNHVLVEIRFSGPDFAFGSSLHSELGKNVWLLMHDTNSKDPYNAGNVTQFSLLYDENRWYDPAATTKN